MTNGIFGSTYAILLNYVSEIEGTKASLVNANEVRQHFEKACELNPNDPTSLHLLGLWHYTFADLPPYKRRLAAWVFASPPETTYEAALSLFEQAERVQPDFYSKNHLYIGKIYVHLQQLDKAKHHLTLAANAPVVSPDDMESHTEAQKMLKDLK